jgi:hypothetical protein
MVELGQERGINKAENQKSPDIGELRNVRIATIGDTVFGYGVAGQEWTPQTLKQLLRERGQLDTDTEAMIDKSGFNRAYHDPFDEDPSPFSDEVQEKQADNAFKMGLELLKRRQMKEIHLLNFGSMTSRKEIVYEIAEKFKQEGIPVHKTRFVDLACFSGFEPAVNRSIAEDYRGLNAMTLIAESISGDVIAPNDHFTRWSFGKGYAGMVWKVGEIEIIDGFTEILEDNGTLFAPLANPLPDASDHIKPSGDYKADGLYGLTFCETEEGVFQEKLESKDGKIHANQKQSVIAFGLKMVEVILDADEHYMANYSAVHGPIHRIGLHHNPSRPIFNFQRQTLVKQSMIRAGATNAEIRTEKLSSPRNVQARKEFIKENLPNYQEPAFITWVMKNAEINNISGGVLLVDATVKGEYGLIPLDKTIRVTGYGVGTNRGIYYIKFHRLGAE